VNDNQDRPGASVGSDKDSRTSLHRLLELLGDGRFLSGEELGRLLGISRSAVWKAIGDGRRRGIEIDAVRGRGYRLRAPLVLLSAEAIVSCLSAGCKVYLRCVRVAEEVDSTNTSLLRESGIAYTGTKALLSEHQTAGRGRRGRSWLAPYGANIHLSLLWRFDLPPISLLGLSVAVGVAVATALEEAAGLHVALKWPNDLYLADRKLGGILIDLVGEASGPCDAVIGLGINYAMPASAADVIDQPWVDLRSALGDTLPSRNLLAGQLLERLVSVCVAYEPEGLQPLLAEWQKRDWLEGRAVEVQGPGHRLRGIARGIDVLGALQLETADGVVSVHSGEVSVRAGT